MPGPRERIALARLEKAKGSLDYMTACRDRLKLIAQTPGAVSALELDLAEYNLSQAQHDVNIRTAQLEIAREKEK